MADATYLPALRPTVRFDIRSLFSAEPLFSTTGLFLLFSMLVTGAAWAIDPRLFQGESVWLKPLKFQFALTVYLLTLAYFARFLPSGLTGRLWYRIFAGGVVFAVAAEVVWIGGAAAFGVASHYNDETPTMFWIYNAMGAFAVFLTSTTLVYGVAIGRNRASTLNPALRLSLALSLILTFVLTVVVASVLSAGTGHYVGTPVNDLRVPVMGWSREVGDLRVAHFFGTHAMQFVPLAGLVAARLLPAQSARIAVWVAAGLFTAFVLGTFVQALNGQPLIPA